MNPALPRAASASLLALLLAAAVTPAAAQWAWKDENGRVVYSDRPPPSSVKPEQIVRQGSGLGGAVVPAPAGATGAGDARAEGKDAKSGPKTFAEREMDYRKRQQERADAEKKAADEAAQGSRKAAECERSRGYLRALEDGQRVARTDAQGNREFLDDSQRAAEISRMRESVSRLCG
jgi:hypothetical protein